MWRFGVHQYQSELSIELTGFKIIPIKEVVVSCCFTADEKEQYVVCATVHKRVWIFDAQKGDVYSYLNVDFMINSISVIPGEILSTFLTHLIVQSQMGKKDVLVHLKLKRIL